MTDVSAKQLKVTQIHDHEGNAWDVLRLERFKRYTALSKHSMKLVPHARPKLRTEPCSCKRQTGEPSSLLPGGHCATGSACGSSYGSRPRRGELPGHFGPESGSRIRNGNPPRFHSNRLGMYEVRCLMGWIDVVRTESYRTRTTVFRTPVLGYIRYSFVWRVYNGCCCSCMIRKLPNSKSSVGRLHLVDSFRLSRCAVPRRSKSGSVVKNRC